MRKLLIVCVACLVVGSAFAATVVLKGGKQLEVQSFEQDGNLLVLRHADGRVESYPLVAVDMDSTLEVNQLSGPAPEPTPIMPHSPFYGAQAPGGESAVVMTDADVMHVPDIEGDPDALGEEEPPANVAITGYQKRRLEDGSWEINANVINQGAAPVSNIVATINLLDSGGELLGSGLGSFAGTLAPGQQGIINATIAAPADPFQITFSLRWQAITPVPASGSLPPQLGGGRGVEPGTQPVPGYSVPPGSSPITMPTDPMAMPPITEPPYPPQIPRGTPPPGREGREGREG